MTRARLFLSPLDGALAEIEIEEPTKLLEIFPDAEVMDWFEQGGTIALNGEVIPPDRWRYVTVKPRAHVDLNFIYVPRGKKTFLLLATVALVALTTAISGGLLGPAGLGFLGSSFAAGGIGANLLAAGVGLAGSLALSALSAPPRSSNTGNEQTVVSAGVNGNVVTILEPLPVVFGKIGFSPPHVMPPYTAWDGNDLTAYAVVGLHGRCLVENVKINGIPAADVSGLEYETREGAPGEAAGTLIEKTVIEERDGIVVTNFKTKLETNSYDLLVNQDDPDLSSPQWHVMRTAGNWDEVVIRFMFPAGIVYTPNATAGVVPMRVEVRKLGDTDWRALPVFHFADFKLGYGSMRAEIRLERIKQPAGRHFSSAFGELPICDVVSKTGQTKSFAYSSDPYFFGPPTASNFTLVPEIPLLTGYTTSGYTVSASSEFSTGYRAWYAADAASTGGGTYWRPALNSLPAWWKVALPSAKTFRSYTVWSSDSVGNTWTYSPTRWMVQGSNDDSTWIDLDSQDVDVSDNVLRAGTYQIENPDSYLYYRIVFKANNGAANNDLEIAYINFHTEDAPGLGMTTGNPQGDSTRTGLAAIYGGGYAETTCRYVSIDSRGCRVFLDPDQWPEGEYEIRVKRGVALYYPYYSSFDVNGSTAPYGYNGNANNSDYFNYYQDADLYKVVIGQKNYRSDCTIEAFQTIANEAPFDETGMCTVAIALPNSQISSIYAEFTRYAVTWDGSSWTNTPVPTQNPAALYRQLLLGECNAKLVPGECLDEDGLADWYENCVINGYQCNAVLQGRVIDVPKQMLATCGFASPRDSESYGVVQDRDTSAEPVRYIISPANSRDTGTKQELPDLPDAIRAEFNDESQSYAVEHVIIYRDGMSAATAKVFETITYQGFTALAKVQQRALFDLRQAQFRQVRYNRVVGFDGIVLDRGELVGLSCDVIDGDKAAGWITAITTVGPDVVSITLDNVMPWSVSQGLEGVDDFSAITDLVDISEPMGVAIRIPGAPALLKQVSDISDSNVCTFTTPFALAGSGLAVDQLVAAGRWGSVMRRCKVMSVKPKGLSQRAVVLADEAPNLFT